MLKRVSFVCVTTILVLSIACSGGSPFSPSENNSGTTSPDYQSFSGTYDIYWTLIGGGCGPFAQTVVFTQDTADPNKLTVELYSLCSGTEMLFVTLTGSVDSDGYFTAEGNFYGGTFTMEGDLVDLTGTSNWISSSSAEISVMECDWTWSVCTGCEIDCMLDA